MKLNGWQRIGIVASVVWIPAGYYCANRIARQTDIKWGAQIMTNCFVVQRSDDGCDKKGEDYMELTIHRDRVLAVQVALVPVPMGWGFAYLLLWIKRGFAPVPQVEG